MNSTKKIQLSALKVNSFITVMDTEYENTVKAGLYATTNNTIVVFSNRTCVADLISALCSGNCHSHNCTI